MLIYVMGGRRTVSRTAMVLLKTSGYRSGVRPNHYFPALSSYAIGQVSFLDGDAVALGETKRALIEFLEWEALCQLLSPGVEWEIREGSTVVGRARVLEVESNEI